MGSLIVAYLGGWLAVAAYVGWMVRQNVRLAQRLDELERLVQHRQRESTYRSAA